MAAKPTIILVPGAWHGPECFSAIVSPLVASGYRTVPVTLPSVGFPDTVTTIEPDIKAVRIAVHEECDAGHDVLLFMHSYAGLPGPEAVKGLSRAERQQQGMQGGVSHLFFCCSLLLVEGECIDEQFGRKMPEGVVGPTDALVVSEALGGPENMFYGDLDEETQRRCMDALRPQNYRLVFCSRAVYPAWQYIPTTYLYATQDQALTFEMQKGMVERAKSMGVDIRTETLEASHSPFLSMPAKVVGAVRRAAGETVL